MPQVNVASQPTGLTFGTADSDAFGFDSNTGRMTQYQFTVGSTPKTVTGQLGWNPNGTLASLGITDQFNSADTQSCTYSYDDLARIGGVNCGSVWAQTFGFDAFGNLTKSGSVSFQPTYNTATNRMASLPGFTPTYDANGNTTADGLHTYAWDAEGHAVTIDSVGLTYDALGRMVEQQSGSTYTEVLYGPTGKLALMNGQTVSKAFIPLTAGATAVYTSGPTLSYFRHPDWLGSSRFASTASRTMYYSGAYAPFGEAYAEAGTPDRSFTGQNQDTIQGATTGLYDFLLRQYAQYGRWISPDPAGLTSADPTNPQSLNRYAHALNMPTTLIDPLGLYPCRIDGGCRGPAAGGGWPIWDDGGYWAGGFGGCYLEGIEVGCGLVNAVLNSGAGVQCPQNNCRPRVIRGKGFAFLSFGADDTINWSFSFSDKYKGVVLTNAALAEMLGLSGTPGTNRLTFGELLDLVAANNMSELPDKLVACVALVESSGDPSAQNPNSSALGLMQMTAPTISSYVLPWYSDNPSFAGFTAQSLYAQQVDPQISIMTGSAYLQMLAYDRWNFGIPAALAHYHYGPGSRNPARSYIRKITKCAK